jgi:hypothetical protein
MGGLHALRNRWTSRVPNGRIRVVEGSMPMVVGNGRLLLVLWLDLM